jgi:hypothetical protein
MSRLRGAAKVIASAVFGLLVSGEGPVPADSRLLTLGLPPLHLRVPATDRAPILVIGHGHAAFNADPRALRGLRRVRREEALQKRHFESPDTVTDALVRNEGRLGYTHPRESADGPEAFIRFADPAKGWDVPDDDRHLRCSHASHPPGPDANGDHVVLPVAVEQFAAVARPLAEPGRRAPRHCRRHPESDRLRELVQTGQGRRAFGGVVALRTPVNRVRSEPRRDGRWGRTAGQLRTRNRNLERARRSRKPNGHRTRRRAPPFCCRQSSCR